MPSTISTGWKTIKPGKCQECGFDDDWSCDGRGNVMCQCQACPECGILDAYGMHEPDCPTLADDDDDTLTLDADDTVLDLSALATHPEPGDTAYRVVYRVFIKLPEGMYQFHNGRDVMRASAEGMFALHPDKPDMIAEVREHAGWYLVFAKVGAGSLVIGSANDRAQYPAEVADYLDSIRGLERVTLHCDPAEFFPFKSAECRNAHA